jgi:hypothetical protein
MEDARREVRVCLGEWLMLVVTLIPSMQFHGSHELSTKAELSLPLAVFAKFYRSCPTLPRTKR